MGRLIAVAIVILAGLYGLLSSGVLWKAEKRLGPSGRLIDLSSERPDRVSVKPAEPVSVDRRGEVPRGFPADDPDSYEFPDPVLAPDDGRPHSSSSTGLPGRRLSFLRVLFVGNSLTFYNDMPGMVAELAAAADQPRPLRAVVEAPGGFTLEQHLSAGNVARRIASRRWDFVVLQEQTQRPSFDPKYREKMMYAPARALHTLIESAGAETMFYLSFARRDGDPLNHPGDSYLAMQQRVIDGYSAIARELGARVAPIGVLWRQALRQRPALSLWHDDGMHPNRLGSYLIACVFYAALYGDSPLGNSYLGGVDPERARYFQSLVASYFTRHPVPAPPADHRPLAPPRRGSETGRGTNVVRVPIIVREEDVASERAAGVRRKTGKPGIRLPDGGKCRAGYDRVRGVCYHRSLPRDRKSRDRIIQSYKKGVVPPLVQ
jgi:hypothetical protein